MSLVKESHPWKGTTLQGHRRQQGLGRERSTFTLRAPEEEAHGFHFTEVPKKTSQRSRVQQNLYKLHLRALGGSLDRDWVASLHAEAL